MSPKQIITTVPNGLARFQCIARGFACMIHDRSAEVLWLCLPGIICSQLMTCTGSASCLCSGLWHTGELPQCNRFLHVRFFTTIALFMLLPSSAAIPLFFFVAGENYFGLLCVCKGVEKAKRQLLQNSWYLLICVIIPLPKVTLYVGVMLII